MTQPDTIAFNILDRSYLIPESDDLAGTHFPMSIMTTVQLRNMPSVDDVTWALHRLVKHFPQLRLGYQLQPEKSQWVRIADDLLRDYLASLVREVDIGSIADFVSESIAENNTPLSQPIQIMLTEQHLIIRMHHSFGDGKFLFLLNQYLLTVLFAEDKLHTLLDFAGWRYPIWKMIWRDVGIAKRVFGQWLGSFAGGSGATSQPVLSHERKPIKSGVPQSIVFKQASSDVIDILNHIRDKLSKKSRISLNTLLQILIAERLAEMGFINLPTTYAIPVDLHRYLPNPDTLYGGNLASQVKVTPSNYRDWASVCHHVQSEVDARLNNAVPLAGIPNEWLLRLGGDKTYKSVNRDWLLKSTETDSRFFVMTNLGNLDNTLGDFASHLQTPNLIVPLMGAPPLILSINTFRGCMNIAITYDPRVLDAQQIDVFCRMFTPQWLNTKLDSVSL